MSCKQAALLEVGDQRGDGLIDLARILLHALAQIVVRVPAVVRDFDEADAALGETPGQQTLGAEFAGGVVVQPVGLLGGFALTCQIENAGRGSLHAERHFVGFDDAFQFGVGLRLVQVVLVERLNQVDLLALRRALHLRVGDVGKLTGARQIGRSLVGRGQKGRTEVLRAALSGRIDGDEAGQILILGAQAVDHPRAHRRPHESGAAGVQFDGGGGMRRAVGGHAVHAGRDRRRTSGGWERCRRWAGRWRRIW